jgi:hypothetical protein
MNEVIQVDFTLLWRVPVFVRGPDGEVLSIRGPEDALRSLNANSHSYEGTMHRSAKSQCVAAVTKAIPCDTAREAFVEACLEAGSLV